MKKSMALREDSRQWRRLDNGRLREAARRRCGDQRTAKQHQQIARGARARAETSGDLRQSRTMARIRGVSPIGVSGRDGNGSDLDVQCGGDGGYGVRWRATDFGVDVRRRMCNATKEQEQSDEERRLQQGRRGRASLQDGDTVAARRRGDDKKMADRMY
ncbi:hypothetical protein Scep_019581 [Stephania cephalantha]|uniref:Uncharacterized protein n=1 Tax=Stephania cephalantha TaxID=152367 RepID=A0AAP0IBA6_9MAGN